MNKHLRWLLLLVSLVGAKAQMAKPSGDYSGVLGPLHVKLHLKTGADSAIEGTLDSPDQGAVGLRCANIHLEGKALSFEVPAVNGKWHGTVSDDGATLSGSWSQGTEIPLVFQLDHPFDAAATPSRVDGIWLGTLEEAAGPLRIQLQVKSDRSGKEYCLLDSLDQGASGIACTNETFDGNRFSFEVPAVRGRWSGVLSGSADELKGTWSQGQDVPLQFTRQAAAILPKAPEPPKFDAAMPAVSVGDLKALLDRDLSSAIKSGALAPESGGGVAIGVIQRGVRRVIVYGTAKEDSIFEIGSISKTFTGLILAQMVEQHRVRLDEPVRDLLPPGTVGRSAGPEITLLDLATQHSGLPRLPDNLKPANMQDPYADYTPLRLYTYLSGLGLSKPADATFLYSNLGVGLLGLALSLRAGMPYADLLREQVTEPLKLRDTVVKLSPDQEKRFIKGYSSPSRPAHAWNFDALAGAGAIRSTAADMLTYLEAQLHPGAVRNGMLADSLRLSQQLHADAGPSMQISLAWLFVTSTGNYWHDGGTGGYSSYAMFNPKDDFAVVVLFNNTITPTGSFPNRLGEHIVERLTGQRAIALAE